MTTRVEIARLLGCVLAAQVAASGTSSAQPASTAERDSLAAWAKITQVLRHPRCLNCHQQDTPLQGDKRRVHIPPVVRGVDDQGAGTMRCHNCHSVSRNNPASGVPGAPHWKLAPVSMRWEGLSNAELCAMLKDTTRNNNRDGPALVKHVETDDLVSWGWKPGGRRQPVPLPHKEFVEQMKIWTAGGAPCPQ